MALGLAEGASILQANHRSHVTLARPQCHKSRMEVRDFVGHQEFKVIFQHVKCRVCVETHGKSLPVYDTFELGTGPVPIYESTVRRFHRKMLQILAFCTVETSMAS